MAKRMEGNDENAKESRFNVFKISSTLQQKYDEHKLVQPIKKKYTVKQSISQRNLKHLNHQNQQSNSPKHNKEINEDVPQFY